MLGPAVWKMNGIHQFIRRMTLTVHYGYSLAVDSLAVDQAALSRLNKCTR